MNLFFIFYLTIALSIVGNVLRSGVIQVSLAMAGEANLLTIVLGLSFTARTAARVFAAPWVIGKLGPVVVENVFHIVLGISEVALGIFFIWAGGSHIDALIWLAIAVGAMGGITVTSGRLVVDLASKTAVTAFRRVEAIKAAAAGGLGLLVLSLGVSVFDSAIFGYALILDGVTFVAYGLAIWLIFQSKQPELKLPKFANPVLSADGQQSWAVQFALSLGLVMMSIAAFNQAVGQRQALQLGAIVVAGPAGALLVQFLANSHERFFAWLGLVGLGLGFWSGVSWVVMPFSLAMLTIASTGLLIRRQEEISRLPSEIRPGHFHGVGFITETFPGLVLLVSGLLKIPSMWVCAVCLMIIALAVFRKR